MKRKKFDASDMTTERREQMCDRLADVEAMLDEVDVDWASGRKMAQNIRRALKALVRLRCEVEP